MYKYISLLLIAIALISCREQNVNPEGGKNKSSSLEVANLTSLGQFDIELQEGYENEINDSNVVDEEGNLISLYAWTYKVQKNSDGKDAKDLSHINFYFCEDVRKSLKAVYFSTDNGQSWSAADTAFLPDPSLANGDCSEYASDAGIKIDKGLKFGEILLVKFLFDKSWVASNEVTEALAKFSTTCLRSFIAGPSCEEKGQVVEEAKYCYSGESAWAAVSQGNIQFPGKNWATYVHYKKDSANVFTLFAGQNINIGTVKVSLVDGKYEYEFSLIDDWYILEAHAQAFMKSPTYSLYPGWLTKSGNPSPGKFALKWALEPAPEFAMNEDGSCLELTSEGFEWDESNLILKSSQSMKDGCNIAIHLSVMHRVEVID